MRAEIAQQPEVFARLLADSAPIRDVARAVLACRPRFALIAARGSSDHAALYAKYLIETQLASHDGPWFLGERFCALDPYVLMLCRWTRSARRPARTLPHVGPYLQRVLARPAVQRVFDKEGLAEPKV